MNPFEYIGSGRRASLWLAGAAIAQTFMASGAVGLSGLDGFGRVSDLHFRNSAGQTLYRSQHAYDAAGNVRWSMVTQRAVDRSRLHSRWRDKGSFNILDDRTSDT